MENYYNLKSWKKIRFIIAISYVLILIVLYLSFILSAQNNSDKWIRDDMTNKLNSLMTSINANFDTKQLEVNSMVRNNSLRNPLLYRIDYAINEFAAEISSSNTTFKKILIADNKNKIVYNNTGFIKSLSEIQTSQKPYSCYIYKNRLFRIYYTPVENQTGRIGTLITFYDFSDFNKTTSESLKNTSYLLYGFFGSKLVMLMDKAGLYFLDKPLKAASVSKLNEGFMHFTVNGDNNLMLVKNLTLSDTKSPFMITLSDSEKQYRSIQKVYLGSSLQLCTVTALFITIILLFMGLGAKYFVNKEISNRLEIKNLRSQRHDFVKHLNIISGMASTNEFEELKGYVECLSSKVVFESTLSKMDNPPVNALIQEKQLETAENNIQFDVSVNASLREIRIDPADLCTVLANLLDNAIEACVKLPSQRHISFEIGYVSKQYFFKISNTGVAIPEKNIDKLFKPGYTTKSGKSNGLGLYIIKRLLKKYRASIRVESLKGITSFTMYLPE